MPTVQTNGVELYYEIQGAGQPLLLIHGLGSSARDWEFQLPEFSKAFQVIRLDLRGHGRSGKPPGPYSVSLFASDAIGLMKSLGIDSAHVAGVSLGGAVALQLALDAPRMVKSLIVVNSAPEFVVCSFRHRLMLWQRLAIVKLMGMRTMGKVLGRKLFPRPEHAGLRQSFAERWAGNDKRAYLAAMRSLVGWSVVSRLGEIRCRTLVVSADHDYTPVAVKRACVRQMPDARLSVIPDSHHALPAEKPREFNRVVLDFLSESADRQTIS